MHPFTFILKRGATIDTVESIYDAMAELFPDPAAAAAWRFDADAEAAFARDLAESNPEALLVIPHAVGECFKTLHRWPPTYQTELASMKRVAAEALAPAFGGSVDGRLDDSRFRVLIMVPWLSNNPNNNALRVVAGYLAGLLRRGDVEESAILVTNETATMAEASLGPPTGAKPWSDARRFQSTHNRALKEFGVPADKVLYAPPPFGEDGNVQWQRELDRSFRPNVVFVPNIEMTSATIHGFGLHATTIYLQTSIRNRPSYDFTRYLYLGGRRTLDDSHINTDRWYYHSFGYEAFGMGNGIRREDMGFTEDDFIIVSAGNRLETEITAEIGDIVASVLDDAPNRKWLLLGARDEARIRANLGDAAAAIGDRLSFEGYVWEVGDYLANCDVYANPRRTGGAVSMALAMYGNTPVISFDGNDACNFLLDEMICHTPGEYSERLARMVADPGHLEDVSSRQGRRFRDGHTVDASVADLVGHFRAALETRARD